MSRRWRYGVRVQLVRERVGEFGPELHCGGDIARLFADELRRLDREQLTCCHLDAKNRLLSHEVVSIGDLTSALVHPREVFKGAILANAARIALVHAHPSGDPLPSRQDLDITKRLVDAGELLGIPVMEHVIIAGRYFLALRERGLA